MPEFLKVFIIFDKNINIFLFFIFFFLVSLFFLFKKEKTLIFILSVYLSYIFTEETLIFNSSFLQIKPFFKTDLMAELLFISITLIFFFLFLKINFLKTDKRFYRKNKINKIFTNILGVGLFTVISLKYFLPPSLIFNLPSYLKFVFLFPLNFFLWMTLPMLILFFNKK